MGVLRDFLAAGLGGDGRVTVGRGVARGGVKAGEVVFLPLPTFLPPERDFPCKH